MDQATKRLAEAYATLDDGSQDEALAEVAAARARLAFLAGDHAEAQALADVALVIAEGLRLPRVLITALMTKANVMIEGGRVIEGTALLAHATSLALEEDLGPEAVRGLYNLAEDKMGAGRFAEADELLERGLAVANRRGDRQLERQLVTQGLFVRMMLGRWDEALANAQAVRHDGGDDQWSFQSFVLMPSILVNRGEMARALELLEPLSADTGWAEPMVMAQCARAMILREMGEAKRALADAREAALAVLDRSLSHTPIEFG
jgi:tetratricopeptide (TPR) repeat protein